MCILAEADAGFPHLERDGAIGFLEAMGERAAFFGDPQAGFECWLWPIEIFRAMRVEILYGGQRVEPAALKVHASVSPESFELAWNGDGVSVSMRVTAARRERAIMLEFLRGDTELDVELVLRPIFRPMWPAGMGGQIARRDESTGAFVLAEELGRFAAVLGSPATLRSDAARSGTIPEERGTDAEDLRIRIPRSITSATAVPFFIAGAEVRPAELSGAALLGGEQSACGSARAEGAIDAALALWRRLGGYGSDQVEEQAVHMRDFLAKTTRLVSSDTDHDRAFEWSKISIERAWTSVDGLGRSVVAGVGASRGSARPGFAWFFGGDALAASRALCAIGDFEGASEALRFVASTQREDGKIAHEITLAASLCDWTRDYPYAYYKAQVTPGFVSCLAHYWRASGDAVLVRELWPCALRALAWCRSTLDPEGRMRVPRAGIAAVEAGPLSGRIASEVFLEGIQLSALAGARELTKALSLDDAALDLERWELRTREAFEAFWCEREGRYGFARLTDGGTCDDLTAYLGLPLSRGIGQEARALASAMQLSRPELCADWGARMFSTRSSIYAAEHYNTGSVFPYLTNFVVLALYAHGLDASALQLLESMVALCGFDGAGFVPEHLEGDLARTPRRGVPHQVFSSGGLLQSTVYGLFGLSPHASEGKLLIRSHLPAHWDHARLAGVRIGSTRLDLELARVRSASSTRMTMIAKHLEGPPVRLIWQPRVAALSRFTPTAMVAGERITLITRSLPSGALEAWLPEVVVAGEMTIALELAEGPRLRLPGYEIERGGPSRQMRMGEVRLRDDALGWQLFGRAGTQARLPFACDRSVRIEGAELKENELLVAFPAASSGAKDAFTERLVSIELVAP